MWPLGIGIGKPNLSKPRSWTPPSCTRPAKLRPGSSKTCQKSAAIYLRGGSRPLKPRILRRAAPLLENLFEAFWDDDGFLLIDDLQDLPPERSAADQGVDADFGRSHSAAV